ncbi:MAG: lamin tail domain-containing protein [Chitinophagales bacterium]|nr:lamin tail domain-containing protein [Chitinophagales bacterium]
MQRFASRILLCTILLIPFFAQAQFTDKFDDGDFTSNPAWSGDASEFVIENIFGDNQLRSNSTVASSNFYLSVPSALVNDCQWEFFVNLAFNTSGANYVDVYLISDSANLKVSNNKGYFVRIGNTPDEISLYKKTGGVSTKIIDGTDGVTNSSNNVLKIKVTRDSTNLWRLERDITGGGINFVTEGTVTDADVLSSGYFGIFIQQSTASFFQKHYFDDFYAGAIVGDTIAPSVNAITVVSNTLLDIFFTEPVEKNSAETSSNYSVNNGIGNPLSAARDGIDSSIVHLTFATVFQNGITNTITVSNVADIAGNALVSASEDFLYFDADTSELYDVIVTEIFADPEPQVGLPVVEFVELHNRSTKVFDLSGWIFSDASSSESLDFYILLPGEYMILCPIDDTAAFIAFGNVLGLGSFPSLNNSGDALFLKNQSGEIIHSVSYSDAWYRDALKKDGGWSLEMLDTDYPCSGAENWKASNNVAGGTPGKINSENGANPDETSPALNYALVQDSLHLTLVFDEALDVASAQPQNFSIDNGIVIDSATFTNEALNEIKLTLASALQQNAIYTITATAVADCSGNSIGVNDSAQFGLSETPDSFDIVINEILSNPVSGGSDFIELYNRSQKIIDLRDIYIASIDEETGDTNAVIISAGYLLLPGNYVALTENPQQIIAQYFTPNQKGVLEVAGMPSFDDDEDIVTLFNRLNNNSVIDAVHYFDDWHFALIDDLNGVSLERINYNEASQNKNNWHSAASTVGYATPAYQNSQFGESLSSTSAITLDPKTFSPNNDGYQDILNIHYQLDQPGYVATITVYDADGRKIREVASNRLLDAEGSITWDGINDDGEKARIGIYIVIVELFNLAGDVEKFKEVCVVAGKI